MCNIKRCNKYRKTSFSFSDQIPDYDYLHTAPTLPLTVTVTPSVMYLARVPLTGHTGHSTVVHTQHHDTEYIYVDKL